MPSTNNDLDSTQKREAILAVATRLFQAEGYDGTRMMRIASEAGVAPNTLYWYFDDKDALLLATLDRRVEEAAREYATVRTKPLHAQWAWMLDQFEKSPGLIATVHARVAVSEAVRDWHDRFHQMMEAMAVRLLAKSRVPEADRPIAARLGMFVFEGLLSHRAGGPEERNAMLRVLASLVTGNAGEQRLTKRRKKTSSAR